MPSLRFQRDKDKKGRERRKKQRHKKVERGIHRSRNRNTETLYTQEGETQTLKERMKEV